jgi:hypothetical protein
MGVYDHCMELSNDMLHSVYLNTDHFVFLLQDKICISTLFYPNLTRDLPSTRVTGQPRLSLWLDLKAFWMVTVGHFCQVLHAGLDGVTGVRSTERGEI